MQRSSETPTDLRNRSESSEFRFAGLNPDFLPLRPLFTSRHIPRSEPQPSPTAPDSTEMNKGSCSLLYHSVPDSSLLSATTTTEVLSRATPPGAAQIARVYGALAWPSATPRCDFWYDFKCDRREAPHGERRRHTPPHTHPVFVLELWNAQDKQTKTETPQNFALVLSVL